MGSSSKDPYRATPLPVDYWCLWPSNWTY